MLKLIGLIFLASTTAAFAQSAPGSIAPDAQTVVTYYRDKAQKADDAAAIAAGQIVTLQAQVAELSKELAASKAPKTPVPETPKTP